MKKFLAEFLGSLLLGASVVGSGIMASVLTGDIALQLFINMTVTVLALFLVISLFNPISGGFFNPLVTLTDLLSRKISLKTAVGLVLTEVLGALAGVCLANLMFNRKAIDLSQYDRVGNYLLLAEVVATAGLVLVIQLLRSQNQKHQIPMMLAAWIGCAFFFTSSTAFANPAITFARSWSNTFAGISMESVPKFIAAQIIGALLGVLLSTLLTREKKHESSP